MDGEATERRDGSSNQLRASCKKEFERQGAVFKKKHRSWGLSLRLAEGAHCRHPARTATLPSTLPHRHGMLHVQDFNAKGVVETFWQLPPSSRPSWPCKDSKLASTPSWQSACALKA
eukprot:1155790-Pelagomonas_calceolata.AAC.3